MPYITANDLMRRDSERDLVSLTDPNGAAVDFAVLQQAIDNAQAEVDSYIAGRVRLPLAADEVSQQLRHVTLLLARYYLYADRKTEAVIAEQEQALRWLRDVAAGRASAGVTQPPQPEESTAGTVVVAPLAKPAFGEAFERLYGVPMGRAAADWW